MKYIKLVNYDTEQVVAYKVKVASNFFTRFIGLMLKKEIPVEEGLLLTKTKQIHTFWMRTNIDVIYLRKLDPKLQQYQVLATVQNMKPWKIGKYYRGATDVLELRAGTLNNCPVSMNDIIGRKF